MTKRMKVAHIITRLELGGAQQNTLYCCARHDRKKYDVILIAGAGGLLDGEARRIPRCRTYLLPELKHPIRPIWDFRALGRIREILKKEKVDIVHTHSSKAGILGRWASRGARVPFIVHTVHGWGFYPGQFPPLRWAYQALERWAAGFTDRLITVSSDNRREGLEAGIGREGQYLVIHSGIDPGKFRSSSARSAGMKRSLGTQGRPVVLVLSNFKAQKSPLDVVETAVLLAERIPGVLFLWAGDGPLKGRTQKRIAALGLEKNFRLLGWRKDPESLLAAADVLFLPSRHEGLPRVVLQAMAAGKPVVATGVNGTPEAVKEGVTGFLAEPGDVRTMAERLCRILLDDDLAARMGKAGRKGLRGTFLIGEMLKKIEGLYGEAPSAT